MKLDFKSRKETSILQRKRDKGWLNGRFREWENKRCDDNNKNKQNSTHAAGLTPGELATDPWGTAFIVDAVNQISQPGS